MPNSESMTGYDVTLLLRALRFAAGYHRDQRRKGADCQPYINHPIAVAEILSRVGGETDVVLLCGALLHDTIEDTDATEDDIRRHFGDAITDLVLEVSDDKALPKQERKDLQVSHAASLSKRARLLKLCDKIHNLQDLVGNPPDNWAKERIITYFEWADAVVSRIRGLNPALDALYDETAAQKPGL